MKIQAPKKIISDDFSQDFKEVADKIGYAVNVFQDETYKALTKGLTINDNLNQELKTLQITVDAQGQPTVPIKFTNNLRGRIQGILGLKVTPSSAITASPYVDFSEINRQITINRILGISAGQQILITLLVMGE